MVVLANQEIDDRVTHNITAQNIVFSNENRRDQRADVTAPSRHIAAVI
jgi:hypothetical protein